MLGYRLYMCRPKEKEGEKQREREREGKRAP